MNLSLVYELVDLFFYLALYAALLLFSVVHRKDIYKAACGGNGIPQPNELIKLFSVYIFTIYGNEVIHGSIVFDLSFGICLLGAIGVANLGQLNLKGVIDKTVENKTSNNKREEGRDAGIH